MRVLLLFWSDCCGRTSKICWIIVASGHPCLVPDLRENAFSFSWLRMFSVALSYLVFLCWGRFLLWVLSRRIFFFVINRCLTLLKNILHLLRWAYGFYLPVCWYISHWLICIYWRILASLDEIPFDHGVSFFQCVVGFCLLEFCWGILHPYSSVILAWNFLFMWYLCLILVSMWWWPHSTSLGVFLPLKFSGRVWAG